MKLIRRSKKGHRGKKGSLSAPLQAGGAVDGGASSNSRRVAPDEVLQVGTTTTGYASSRDEAFFEASPWLDSDCEDDFFSVNGDATPARTFSTAASDQATTFVPQVLPTLGAILKAEPLKPRSQIKLGDLLKVKQEPIDDADDLSRAGSSVGGDEAGRCCIPQFARVVSYKERRKESEMTTDGGSVGSSVYRNEVSSVSYLHVEPRVAYGTVTANSLAVRMYINERTSYTGEAIRPARELPSG